MCELVPTPPLERKPFITRVRDWCSKATRPLAVYFSKTRKAVERCWEFIHKNVLGHPIAKWLAGKVGWGLIAAGVAMAQWDEYAVSLALFFVGCVILLLKAYHWKGIDNRPGVSAVLRALLVICAGVGIAASWPITVAKKGDKLWSLLERKPAAQPANLQAPPPKWARLQFTFWTDDPNGADLVPIRETTVPLVGDSVTIAFTARNIGYVGTQRGEIWIRICSTCKFAKEPEGWQHIKGAVQTDRERVIQNVFRGTFIEKMTAEIVPPVGAQRFEVDFFHACDTCEPPENPNNPAIEKLWVNVLRPQ